MPDFFCFFGAKVKAFLHTIFLLDALSFVLPDLGKKNKRIVATIRAIRETI